MYIHNYICNNQLGSLSTEVAVAITCVIAVILTLTIATVIIPYICVKRKILHKNDQRNEAMLNEQVGPSSNSITKNDLKPQQNPAYGTSQKVTNPAYESYK